MRRTMIDRVGLLMALLSAAGVAAAQQGESGAGYSVGVGVIHRSVPYRGHETDTIPAPLFSYEGRKYFFRGIEFGRYLVRSPASSLSIKATPYLQRFRPEDTRNLQMKALSEREWLALIGLEWRTQQTWGGVSVSWQAEVTGTGGSMASAIYNYPMRMGMLTVIPEAGVVITDAKIARHYYGVGASEAMRSGLRPHRPGLAKSPFIGVSTVLPLGERWSAIGSIKRARLDDEISSSPMVESRYDDTLMLALNYRF